MEQAQEHAQSASRLASALGEWVVHVPLCRTCTTEIPNRQPAPLVARRTTRHRLTFYPIIRKYWLIANSHWWSFSAPWRLTTYIYRFSTVPLIDVYMRKHITIGIRVTARQGEFSPKEYEKERLTRANISGMTSLLHLWGTIRGEILGTMGSRRGRNRRNCVLNRRPWRASRNVYEGVLDHLAEAPGAVLFSESTPKLISLSTTTSNKVLAYIHRA